MSRSNNKRKKELDEKRLLILGGGTAVLDVVRAAKEAGAYVVVADYYEGGVAKELADKAVTVSTVDFPALLNVIKEEKIDGVFTGPSEFNLKNAMVLSKMAGLRFYANEEQWEICSDKALFKETCRKYGVPCIPEYRVTEEFLPSDLKKIRYPVIVKPVDASSSRGVSVCFNGTELKKAYEYALSCSVKKHVIVEKYISNIHALSARYVVYNGKAHLLLTDDRHIVDPEERKALICHVGIFPSSFSEKYIKEVDPKVRHMFEEMGLNNCTLFLQALMDPDDGNIYFHEMGLRLSGGMTYAITEPITGVSELTMMLRGAVGLEFSSDEEIAKIDPLLHGKTSVIFSVPLKSGTIASVEGIDECIKETNAENFIQYYSVGDTIPEEKIGSLDQLFGRIKFITNGMNETMQKIEFINKNLRIKNADGEDMIFRKFNVSRLSSEISRIL